MMQHKFPFTSLFITVNSENVDVNVHPSKMEVRFEKTDLVYQTLYRAICDALTEKELIPEVSFTPKKDRVKEFSRPSVPEPFEIRRREMLRETPAYAPAPADRPVSGEYTGSHGYAFLACRTAAHCKGCEKLPLLRENQPL